MSTVEAIKNFFIQTGAAWVLWLLFGLSFVSIAIVIERIFVFRTKGTNLKRLADKLDLSLSTGDLDKARESLRGETSLCARVADAGLRLASRGPSTADKGMQSAIAIERSLLEARLAYLGTLGNNAPFVGLFGTVIGIILAFHELGQAQAGGGGQMASQAVMGSIAEALVATAVGIAVALPAVASYNYFQRWIASLLADAEALSNLVLAYLCADPERSALHHEPATALTAAPTKKERARGISAHAERASSPDGLAQEAL
ncbi:MAG: MotA/TolQ/ExbB proton channel family protein [Myxococcaceae bacterium]|nr:MotA/TolQ/ExbB proton channel family protein [Myxococcaceae bacterium]